MTPGQRPGGSVESIGSSWNFMGFFLIAKWKFLFSFSGGGEGIWMSNVQGVCTNGSIALKKCCVMGVISTIQEYQKKG